MIIQYDPKLKVYTAKAESEALLFKGEGFTKKQAIQRLLQDISSGKKEFCRTLNKLNNLEAKVFRKYEIEKYSKLK